MASGPAQIISTAIKTTTSVRRTAYVLLDDGTVTIKGPGIFEALRPYRLRPIFVGTVGGWMLDRDRLPDVLAALDHAGYQVRGINNITPDGA